MDERENYCRNCEAWCCYDGVYLTEDDEDKIKNVVGKNSAFFDFLPKDFIIDGVWENVVRGRKTNTKPKQYSKDFPKHFTKTTCVFLKDNICMLEVFAVKNNEKPWTYKPTTCCTFPLQKKGGEYVAPHSVEDRCNLGEKYPGFVSFLPCYKLNMNNFSKEREFINSQNNSNQDLSKNQLNK